MIESVQFPGVIEIYPKIVVYKNLFRNIENIYNVLENSDENDSNRLFSKWSKWSTFGKYLQPISTKVNWDFYDIVNGTSHITDDFDQEQKSIIIEIMQAFNRASADYIHRCNLPIDLNEEVTGHDGVSYKLWRRVAPVICRYDMLSYDNRKMTMKYHSDYVREPMSSPGYKFAITALLYFNDDYDGGEIEFAIGKKTIKYKPEAGDFVFFPSGHPDILTEDEMVYLHGVHPIRSGNNKLFLRMFWQHYNIASEEWAENEAKFGKDNWEKQYEVITNSFKKTMYQKDSIKDAIVIDPKLG